jgi:hypothetical protein
MIWAHGGAEINICLMKIGNMGDSKQTPKNRVRTEIAPYTNAGDATPVPG